MKYQYLNSAILLLSGFILVSCSFADLRKRDMFTEDKAKIVEEVRSGDNSCVIMGKITSKKRLRQPLLLIAYPLKPSEDNQERQFSHIILENSGTYMLYLPEGDYQLYAIVDFNGNNDFEKNEVSGSYRNQKKISIQAGELVKNIDIFSQSVPVKTVEFPEETGVKYEYNSVDYRGKNGQLSKIYSAAFSGKNADAGLWAPSSFMRAFGANIYLQEKYDPQKVPILFVHGVKGSPQDWVSFLIRLDRKRYQPWYFYYPSGMRLPLLSKILYEKLTELHKEHGFKRMCLTAHSMGGLLTRSMLTSNDFDEKNSFISLYITLATPWSGFESADTAISTSPRILPSWIDVASRSIFIKKTLGRSLPESIPYFLFHKESLYNRL